jgi:GT2 family glycosyltransferase
LYRIKRRLLKHNIFFKLYQKYKKRNPFFIKVKQKDSFDCILHGSCIIFSKNFFEQEFFAFLPITYMYNEENILYDYLKFKGYKTGYCNNSSVMHMEGIATSSRINKEKDIINFRFKHYTDSLIAQLKERKKYIDEEKE